MVDSYWLVVAALLGILVGAWGAMLSHRYWLHQPEPRRVDRPIGGVDFSFFTTDGLELRQISEDDVATAYGIDKDKLNELRAKYRKETNE